MKPLEFQINVVCLCGATIPCEPSRSGRRVRCPYCGETHVVPALAVRNEKTGETREISDPGALIQELISRNVAKKTAALQAELELRSTTTEGGTELSSTTGSDRSRSDSASIFAQAPNPIARKIVRRSSRQLNKYRVVNLIAKGGMGRVSLARDDEMERTVVVKEIRSKYANNPIFQRRFIVEAKITGCLDHPGVAPVYSLELDENGAPFYSMRKIDGVTFEKAFAEYRRARSPERLKILLRHFIAACQTLEYAHHAGVVHRDVKPANIMIGRYETTFVMDWGLAKKTDSVADGPDEFYDDNLKELVGETNMLKIVGDQEARSDDFALDLPEANPTDEEGGEALTAVNERVGTPWYRDPDYIKTGISKPCNDIYAMGVVLYAMLTGETPYKGSKMNEATAVLMETPTPPAQKVRGVPRPLSDVCMKALEKNPENRYPSFERFADDVRRWLENEPVSVRRYSFFDRLRKRYQ